MAQRRYDSILAKTIQQPYYVIIGTFLTHPYDGKPICEAMLHGLNKIYNQEFTDRVFEAFIREGIVRILSSYLHHSSSPATNMILQRFAALMITTRNVFTQSVKSFIEYISKIPEKDYLKKFQFSYAQPTILCRRSQVFEDLQDAICEPDKVEIFKRAGYQIDL